jgi:hypothetical protein
MFIDLDFYLGVLQFLFIRILVLVYYVLVVDIILEMDETQQKSISWSTNIISIFMRVVQLKV